MPGLARELTAQRAVRTAGVPARWPRARPTTPCSSPTLGDHLAFYGDRSILNYRRIPTSDPDLPGYHLEEVEPCLVQIVDRLLADATPVYYVEDTAPLLGLAGAAPASLHPHPRVRRAAALPGHRAGHAPCRRHACPVPTPAPTRVSAQWFG
ncbi:MAG: hypothetical protein R2838_12730 [Caldilineaceae bacterium]